MFLLLNSYHQHDLYNYRFYLIKMICILNRYTADVYKCVEIIFYFFKQIFIYPKRKLKFLQCINITQSFFSSLFSLVYDKI